MKIIRTLGFITLCCLASLIPINAQSIKEIINDKSGKYIYVQTMAQELPTATSLAVEELSSLVASYIELNKLSRYNSNWKDCIKQIDTQKYGRYRVFLYLCVEDLTSMKKDADTKVDTKKSVASPNDDSESKSKHDLTSINKQSPTIQVPTSNVKEYVANNVNEIPESKYVVDSKESNNYIGEVYAQSDGDTMIDEVIKRILSSSNSDEVARELQRGKNMGIISIYGDNNSKYLSRAYLVCVEGGLIKVLSPCNKDGERTNLTDGTQSSKIIGKMMYWFLKK